MPTDALQRDSVEYIELLADVFAEIVQKGKENKHAAEAADVTPALMQCLQFVYLHGPCSVRRIAQGLSISVPAGSQLVERLVRRGLVTRQENDEDRRLSRIDLTDTGRENVKRARAERGEWFRTVIDRLPANKRCVLVDSLEEFVYLALDTGEDVEKACIRCGIDHLAFCVLNRAHRDAVGTPIEDY